MVATGYLSPIFLFYWHFCVAYFKLPEVKSYSTGKASRIRPLKRNTVSLKMFLKIRLIQQYINETNLS